MADNRGMDGEGNVNTLLKVYVRVEYKENKYNTGRIKLMPICFIRIQ